MRRFFFVLLLLIVGIFPEKLLESLAGDPSIGVSYGKLMAGVLSLTVVYGVLKTLFFPSPIAVIVVEPRRRRRWFKWPSSRTSNQ
jgi:hypothetical protein